MGFRIAHKNALDERRSRVIIITKGNIGCVENIQRELKAYINLSIHLEWDEQPKQPEKAERRFFNKLRFAIAQPKLFNSTTKTAPNVVNHVDV